MSRIHTNFIIQDTAFILCLSCRKFTLIHGRLYFELSNKNLQLSLGFIEPTKTTKIGIQRRKMNTQNNNYRQNQRGPPTYIIFMQWYPYITSDSGNIIVFTSESGNFILSLQRVEISCYHFTEWKYHFTTPESGNIILSLQRVEISFYHFREWKYHFITPENENIILSLQRVKISFYHFREWT